MKIRDVRKELSDFRAAETVSSRGDHINREFFYFAATPLQYVD